MECIKLTREMFEILHVMSHVHQNNAWQKKTTGKMKEEKKKWKITLFGEMFSHKIRC